MRHTPARPIGEPSLPQGGSPRSEALLPGPCRHGEPARPYGGMVTRAGARPNATPRKPCRKRHARKLVIASRRPPTRPTHVAALRDLGVTRTRRRTHPLPRPASCDEARSMPARRGMIAMACRRSAAEDRMHLRPRQAAWRDAAKHRGIARVAGGFSLNHRRQPDLRREIDRRIGGLRHAAERCAPPQRRGISGFFRKLLAFFAPVEFTCQRGRERRFDQSAPARSALGRRLHAKARWRTQPGVQNCGETLLCAARKAGPGQHSAGV